MRVQAIEQIKLEVEWKIAHLSVELVGVRPLRRRGVVPTCGRGRLDFTFGENVFGLPVHPVVGWLGCVWRFSHHMRTSGVLPPPPVPKEGKGHDTGRVLMENVDVRS